ncbi:hypothetical protein UlMin_022402 [Ulmus minor]
MEFDRGDKIEVCNKEEGFLGSYYAATVVSQLPNSLYVVQYKNLLEDNWSDPLMETISSPLSEFSYLDEVDAFDNDGWWVGKITGKIGSDYLVLFEMYEDEIAYPSSRLRFHLEWRNGFWVSSKNKVYFLHSSFSFGFFENQT